MKRFSLLLVILVLAVSLTGCFGGETKLYNAFNKMQEVTAIQTEMTMGFNLETEGFPEETKAVLDQVSAVVNNIKIQINQKTLQNEDKTFAKSELDMNLDSVMGPMNMKVWVVADLEEPQLLEIIKLPQILSSQIFPGQPAKEYLVYDIGDLMDLEGGEVDFEQLMEFSKDFQVKFTEFMKEIQKDFKPGFNVVESKGSKLVRNQNLDIYELKLDDAALKELIKYAVNYSLDNETAIEFIKEYMNAVTSMVVVDAENPEEVEKEIQKELEALEKQLPEFKEKFNEFMEEYKDIEILGEKGIVIEYGINNKGYIVHEEGTIDLAINLEKIAKAIGEEAGEMKGVIKLGINYTGRNYNINSKVLGIMLPRVNEKNSVNFMELMEMQMNQVQPMPTVPAPEPVKVP